MTLGDSVTGLTHENEYFSGRIVNEDEIEVHICNGKYRHWIPRAMVKKSEDVHFACGDCDKLCRWKGQ